jgi:hypothetical protein
LQSILDAVDYVETEIFAFYFKQKTFKGNKETFSCKNTAKPTSKEAVTHTILSRALLG